MHKKFYPLIWLFVVALIALYVQAWAQTQIRLTDFPAFYASGRLLRAGENPYDRAAECGIQGQIRSDLCMPTPHTPVLLPLFAVISTDNYAASYTRWSAILLLVLGVCAWVGYKLSGNMLSAVCMVLFQPIFISITQGNITPFILLAVLLWVLLLRENKDFWAGLALSLTVVKPQLALGLGLPMAFVRPKAFLGLCAGGFAFAAIGFGLVGVEGYRSLLDTIASMARGQEAGTDPTKMFSVTGLLTRAGLNKFWAWPIFAAAIIGTTLLWRKRLDLRTHMIGIVLAVFASPHLFTHDLSLLAVPLLLVHPIAPIAASCVLLLAQSAGAQYAGAYLLMAALIVFYWLKKAQDDAVDRLSSAPA